MHITCPSCTAINRLPRDKDLLAGKCGKCHSCLFEKKSITLTMGNFQKHLTHNDIPLLVDFWAPWCSPCKNMAPEFERAAAQLAPHVVLGKIDTEEHQSLAIPYAIRSIPTMILFQHGKEISRVSGAMSSAQIIQWTNSKLRNEN